MKKSYICSNCGYVSISWLGKCPQCSQWGTFEETFEGPSNSKATKNTTKLKSYTVAEAFTKSYKQEHRIKTGFNELDRVLGGGILDAQVCLMSGQPGIGKSTLLLQMCINLSKTLKCCYVSGEESLTQIANRASRLIGKPTTNDFLKFFNTQDLDSVLVNLEEEKFDFVVFDSIQTLISDSSNTYIMGSIAQVRESAVKMINFAKNNGIPIFVVGHINKDGEIAGPILLEHLVDTVLYFESDENNDFRILKSKKNRFGNVGEVAVFSMAEEGLKEISDPSEILVTKRSVKVDGVAKGVIYEGSRNFLIEVQALVGKNSSNVARRVSKGVTMNKLQILAAIIDRHTKCKIYDKDVFVNLPAGFQTTDASLDLAVCASIISSALGKPMDENSVMIGEVSLTGEIRMVSRLEGRIKEALDRGISRVYIPQNSQSGMKFKLKPTQKIIKLGSIAEIFS